MDRVRVRHLHLSLYLPVMGSVSLTVRIVLTFLRLVLLNKSDVQDQLTEFPCELQFRKHKEAKIETKCNKPRGCNLRCSQFVKIEFGRCAYFFLSFLFFFFSFSFFFFLFFSSSFFLSFFLSSFHLVQFDVLNVDYVRIDTLARNS